MMHSPQGDAFFWGGARFRKEELMNRAAGARFRKKDLMNWTAG